MKDGIFKSRRGDPRIQATDRFLIEFRRSSGKIFEKGYGCDLSVSGAKFATLAKLEEHHSVEMTICFTPAYPGLKKVTLPGTIVRSQNFKGKLYRRVACRFDEKAQAARWILEDFMIWVAAHPSAKRDTDRGKASKGDRRSVKRIHAADEFLLEFRHGKKKLYDKGYGCDLSVAGAKFTTLVPFKEGNVLDMILYFSPFFPGPKKVELCGEVVQVESAKTKIYRRIGCRFHGGESAARETLEQFLSWVETRAPAL